MGGGCCEGREQGYGARVAGQERVRGALREARGRRVRRRLQYGKADGCGWRLREDQRGGLLDDRQGCQQLRRREEKGKDEETGDQDGHWQDDGRVGEREIRTEAQEGRRVRVLLRSSRAPSRRGAEGAGGCQIPPRSVCFRVVPLQAGTGHGVADDDVRGPGRVGHGTRAGRQRDLLEQSSDAEARARYPRHGVHGVILAAHGILHDPGLGGSGPLELELARRVPPDHPHRQRTSDRYPSRSGVAAVHHPPADDPERYAAQDQGGHLEERSGRSPAERHVHLPVHHRVPGHLHRRNLCEPVSAATRRPRLDRPDLWHCR